MRYRSTGPVALLPLLLAVSTAAQQPAPAAPGHTGSGRESAPARRVLLAAPIAGQAPVIDGRLDDRAWQNATAATDFIVFEPNAGEPAAQRTEARILYDERAIYVGIRLYDTSPDSIVAQLARRDQTVHSDWVFVAFDSYLDRRTAFVFGVNPRSVKFDMMVYDDNQETVSWDAIWDVATSVDSLGWTAEFRIPLSQLRFSGGSNGGDRVWGVQFRRLVARTGESSFWAPMPRDAPGLVSQFGDLHGLRGIDPPRNIELLPYAVSRLTRAPEQVGNPFYRRNSTGLDFGGDLKYGVTTDLTLNATVNPDFGQVEADPSVVNLTAFETFLPEKRPFFVEGANIFNFGIGLGDGGMGNESLFYSRRIGRRPQGSAPGSAAHHDTPAATRILGATKLSGRTAGGWSIGLLDAVTGPEHARYVGADGAHGEALVEPWTNYAVARVSRDYDDGRGSVGAIATATNRHLDGELTFLRTAAYTGGLNAHRRLGDLQLSGWFVGSHIRGDADAIDRAQRAPARYFQRPDNEHVTYDPTLTSLSGWAGSAQALKMSGGHWRMGTIINVRSPGFEANDLGYMQNADMAIQAVVLGYEQFKPSPRFRRWSLFTNMWHAWNFGGDRLEVGGNVNGNLSLPNFWGGWGNINRQTAAVDVFALRGGPALAKPGTWQVSGGMHTDQRRPLRVQLNANASFEDDTDAGSWRIAPSVVLRAANRTELSLSPAYSKSESASQYVARRTVAGEPVYLLGGLEQSTASLTARLSYTVSPALSLQLYAQPFVSAGRYTYFMEVAEPRAEARADRVTIYDAAQLHYDPDAGRYSVDRDRSGTADFSFGNPDFNFKQLRSNAVLRYEYRPGSSLFVVWSHGRTAADEFGDFRFNRDVSDLWSAAGTNALMIKLSYWLGI
jgi:hypothetical protein